MINLFLTQPKYTIGFSKSNENPSIDSKNCVRLFGK